MEDNRKQYKLAKKKIYFHQVNVVSKKPVGGTFKPSSKNLRSGRVNIIQHNSINSKYPPSTFTPLILFSMVCVLVKDSNCKCEFPICKEIQRPAPFRICENSFIHNGLFQIWFPSRTFFFFFSLLTEAQMTAGSFCKS